MWAQNVFLNPWRPNETGAALRPRGRTMPNGRKNDCPLADRKCDCAFLSYVAHGNHKGVCARFVNILPSWKFQPIYVQSMSRSHENFPHTNRIRLIKQNLLCVKSARNYYINGLFSYLKQAGYKPSEIDSCLISRLHNDGHNLFAVIVDSFLAISCTQAMLHKFPNFFTCIYTIKILGRPTIFL